MTFAGYQAKVRAALVRDGTERAGPLDSLTRVCAVSVEMLTASGATVTATTVPISAAATAGPEIGTGTGAGIDGFVGRVGGSRRLMAASGFAARALDDAQGTLRCGPAIDVAVDGRPVLAPDLAVDGLSRWPAFARVALARGVRAAFALPLQIGAIRLGVLGVYRERPGPLSPRERWIASALAEAATDVLIDTGGPAPEPEVADLPGAPAALQALYQAHGMVMIDLQVPLTEAIARLRQHANEHHLRPSDVARSIVAGQLRLSPR